MLFHLICIFWLSLASTAFWHILTFFDLHSDIWLFWTLVNFLNHLTLYDLIWICLTIIDIIWPLWLYLTLLDLHLVFDFSPWWKFWHFLHCRISFDLWRYFTLLISFDLVWPSFGYLTFLILGEVFDIIWLCLTSF
jgi:hypothetical protein